MDKPCQQPEEEISHETFTQLFYIDNYKAKQKLHPIEFQILTEFKQKYIINGEKMICLPCVLMIKLIHDKVNNHAL